MMKKEEVPPALWCVFRRKCREKTEKGNVFCSRKKANQKAVEVRRKTREPVQAFQCEVCGHYHIGKRPKKEE